MNNRLYTVKDIAAAIAVGDDPNELQRVMRQVRHWTNNDLLAPAGGKNTGTGVSRVYYASEIYKAALAAELTRYGVTVEMLTNWGEWIDGIMAGPRWRAAVEDGEDFFLQFAFHPSDGSSIFKPLNEGEDILITAELANRSRMYLASAIMVNIAILARNVNV